MWKRRVAILTVLIAVACVADLDVAGIERFDGPQANTVYIDSFGSGSANTYRVQAHTSVNGQLLSMPSCLVQVVDTHIHSVKTRGLAPNDTFWRHRDVRARRSHNGSCNAPSPYNGGWINVYEVDDEGEHFVGQVGGDLVYKDFTYNGPAYKTIRLYAFADMVQTCSFMGETRNFTFLGFDNHGSQNPIDVTGQGDLPLAHFACPP